MFKKEKCQLCGECFSKCHYVDYDREKSIVEMKLLRAGKGAEIVSQCSTCAACNSTCPNGANPFDLTSCFIEQSHLISPSGLINRYVIGKSISSPEIFLRSLVLTASMSSGCMKSVIMEGGSIV